MAQDALINRQIIPVFLQIALVSVETKVDHNKCSLRLFSALNDVSSDFSLEITNVNFITGFLSF